MQEAAPEQIDAFIERWQHSGGHERGSGQQFLLEFCELLGLEKPAPPVAENELNSYTFERRVDRRKPDGSSAPNWIDLYKSGHFVLETKQGVNPRRDKSDPDQPLLPSLDSAPANHSLGHGRRGSAQWDKALDRAHSQAERYIHLLPTEEGRPPFLIVCDVGHCFDLYAEFSGTGGQYEPFPDPRSRRILLRDLHKPEIRERLRAIWHDPHSLDPSKYAAQVTREVAKALADLAKSLEKDGHDPQVTAGFLQRCLFTMFAEDVGLLPKDSFFGILVRVKDNPAGLVTMLHALWKDMATGSDFSVAIQEKIPHFNGGLFQDASALPLRPDQIVYLIHAAKQDWSAVEPAIFGTLLERALDPRERHKLGAHYTPRSYVERLVRPTIIDPLRAEWESVKIAAAQLDEKGKTKDARAAVESFHHKLAKVRVLDPACGSGNFLYVSLALLKTLEAEVLDLFEKLGGNRSFEANEWSIRPKNFLGIELNPRAAAIAQLVLWIGYFQWHQRTTGKADTNDRPLLPKQNTIECRDAVLAYDEKIPRKDPDTGEYVTIWDGRTTKPHPVTGKEVPDESARIPLFDYTNPKRAEWPEADYIVGNPPFIGNKRMRDALGDGYVEALRCAFPDVDKTVDLVLYWWKQAADGLSSRKFDRAGLISTNSITQKLNRGVLEKALTTKAGSPRILFAVPDHPWVDSNEGAAVRISMVVAGCDQIAGELARVTSESTSDGEEVEVELTTSRGTITSDLRIGADLTSLASLKSNSTLAFQGIIPLGSGFILDEGDLGTFNLDPDDLPRVVRPYICGRDLVKKPEDRWIIDFFALSVAEAQKSNGELFQRVLTTVKPKRDQNKRATRRENWWLYGENAPKLRGALNGIRRFIGTPDTSKHKPFVFISSATLPDVGVYAVAADDAAILAILSSIVHQSWLTHVSPRLEDRPRWKPAIVFDPYPFPALDESPLKQRIRELGEKLDAHRKARQAAHPGLTLTGIYNVLETLRRGEALSDKERRIHDEGLVTILKQIHDDLDAAVLEAYGWEDLGRDRSPSGPAPASSMAEREESPSGPSPGPPCTSHSHGPPGGRSLPIADVLARGGEAAEALEQELLQRLVSLNHERAAEEKRGLVRWLRPEYQNPVGRGGPAEPTSPPEATQSALELPAAESHGSAGRVALPAWPKALSAQVAAIQKLLPATGPDASALAGQFGKRTKARVAQIEEILKTLGGLGKL